MSVDKDVVYVSLQIGNSDDKLLQTEWAQFVADTARLITVHVSRIYFHGCAEGSKPWQNACWVFLCTKMEATRLKNQMMDLRKQYKQDCVAWLEGVTELL